ncbi:putative phytoene synthase [Corynebacterium kutscheri]|uniref:Phytoene synthase n=1 Tax=Corynebacterium kutscheri TaxID=35755 RepID=A0A0F6QZ48_9CORY|nr:squalene/phytoene synthase family protein [Corynebacterium kutscheri]AKE40515.1 phytoene/squalene synthetase [Corynebacterium kutscheri]VEH05049.1 putative phytoene synthase [Corynebacterium kutscheri]VEH10910.1 putative phytoene synthase [Corynebacterium kutscheri]VEH80614.1 putative phytoene synthase [Corynebacterium kutscheri]
MVKAEQCANLDRYDAMAIAAAKQVIARYSTSFSLATALLPPRIKEDITNLYAMVRIADEIVDGLGQCGAVDVEKLLEQYACTVIAAPLGQFHSDVIVHAYAITARRCGFPKEYVLAFFDSMRMDLSPQEYDQAALARYIYGSAEVIGLLCLRCFYAQDFNELSPTRQKNLEKGARHLGAAFQKINFLRDIAEDTNTLGRNYFSSFSLGKRLTENAKKEIIADIRSDIASAEIAVQELKPSVYMAVASAMALFNGLTDKLAATSVDKLYAGRVRLSAWEKTRIISKIALGGWGKERRTTNA